MKKNIFCVLTTALALSLAFSACKDDTIHVTGVTLDETTLVLMPGDEGTLAATVLPEDAADNKVSWQSSDTSVVTVDADNGNYTAVAEGEAIITATTKDGNKTATCDVTVSWLGKVSFKTTRTWTVGTQTWSDAVMAVRCRKDDFDGGTYGSTDYKIDCRQNNPGYGDLFSWKAVDQYKAQLCPEGWRVPTAEDFYDLDIALGGNGENRSDSAIISLYLDEWGGEFGGYCEIWESELLMQQQDLYAAHWSQTEYDADQGSALNFGTVHAFVTPQAHSGKYNGYVVRCVK